MPAAGYKTVKSEMYLKTDWQGSGFIKWRITDNMTSSKNAQNVSCLRGAGAVRRLRPGRMEIFMMRTRSAGRKFYKAVRCQKKAEIISADRGKENAQ